MCLMVKKTRPKKRRWVYKVVYPAAEMTLSGARDGKYRTLFQSFPCEIDKEMIPVEKPNTTTEWEGSVKRNFIHGGVIHVCRSYRRAREFVKAYGGCILSCEVDPKDWVADGYNGEAAYAKATPRRLVLDKKSPFRAWLKEWWKQKNSA